MANPYPQFTYYVEQLAQRFPTLAYVHAVEARIDGAEDGDGTESIGFLHDAWGRDRVFLRAGGFTLDNSVEATDGDPKTVVVVGRHYISNPDLPVRWKEGIELEPYDRKKFYNAGQADGYTTYKNAVLSAKAKV